MVASDRSIGALGALDGLLGGEGWPPGQLPPAAGRPPPSAALGVSAGHQLRMGGLLSALGDALLGQDLAQPGMLVVHVSFPSCSSVASPGDNHRLSLAS
jgi:hypothetical protein